MPTNLQICQRWLHESMKPDPATRKFVGRGEGNWKRSIHGFDVPGRCLHTGEDDDHLYSFGDHFELARWIWTSKTKGFLLINGDVATTGSGKVSSATSNHQGAIRDAGTLAGVTMLTLPFSALRAAGIDLDSIWSVEIRPDRWDRWLTPFKDKGEHNALQREIDQKVESRKSYERRYGRPYTKSVWELEVTTPDGCAIEIETEIYGPSPVTGNYRHFSIARDTEGRLWLKHQRHWLGDAVFSANYRQAYRRRPTTEELVEHTNRQARNAADWEAAMAHRSDARPYPVVGPPEWITFQRQRKGYFLSSFDYQEPQALYFLCQVPSKPRGVEEAIDLLAPRAVHAAHAQGRTVVRQGDIFAISVPEISREDLVNRGGTFVPYTSTMPPCHREEVVKAKLPEGYRMIWGQIRMDHGGYWGSTWSQERADQEAGRPWISHPEGGWKLYPPDTTFVEGYRYYRDWRNDTPTITGHPLIGTAHTATEVCICPDGTTYARGTMIHAPQIAGETRDPDHINQPLGDGSTWFLILRNTVPRQRTITWRGNGIPANR